MRHWGVAASITLVVLALAGVALWIARYRRGVGPRVNVLVPHGEREVVVMDFNKPLPLDPPPPGWYHRKFLTRPPMNMSFTTKDGVAALRCETHASGSMLFRHVDIDLRQYPILSWRWYVEQPIDSPLDERTRQGDDHPARIFVAMRTASGVPRAMEVIWGNRLKAGDYKYIGGFPHYIADGGDENIGKWRREEINLERIYEVIWKDAAPARVVEMALFCDSDDTRTSSISYFANVEMKQVSAQP